MIFNPGLLKMNDGRTVTDTSLWPERRKELLDILSREEYGYMPAKMGETVFNVKDGDDRCCAAFAKHEIYEVSFPTEKGTFSFPFSLITPATEGKHLLFMFMNFTDNLYGRYLPLEEIIANGFALALICYKDVTSDDGDMGNGLSGMYVRPSDGTGYGKISLWAFGISRALDCLTGRNDIDFDNVAVIGHSRLGKTALWCGANDERFKYSISSCSGCGGASFEQIKRKGAETIADMNRNFPFWFCENRQKYADRSLPMPFDQHFLLGAIAPRRVLIGSAIMDNWADPYSEQLCCIASSPAFELSGKGFCGKEEPAVTGDNFDEGRIAYHLRDGCHFLARSDWHIYMDYIKKNINND
ncbi:MAG: hypothetical protein K6F64_00030 [Clostridia bacterium]|nr:hypothetical protein [Clostridia bacterium]